MNTKRNSPIPEVKTRTVKEIENLIKNKKTILIASIKNIPASQFQEICKKLRGKAIVKVPKKNLIFRAFDSSSNENVKKLKEQIQDSIAVLFSDLDCFDLATELVKNKSPAKAKPGQESPMDIEVEAGPTELPPGPAISELGAVGLQVQIEKGKIHIKESKVIVKKGEKISHAAADVMAKLDIKPFSVGFIPLVAFDNQKSKLYLEIKINPEETIINLKTSFGKALPFAVKIGYVNSETISFLLSKAERNAKCLENLKPVEETQEVQETKQEVSEENQTQEVKTEEEK
ncbi:MAG: 50S ribosomal protein L10 [Nanoarchaeota archaeon]|nr:50S ribosomal protein L10 [Nanoarchaeota archaeon]